MFGMCDKAGASIDLSDYREAVRCLLIALQETKFRLSELFLILLVFYSYSCIDPTIEWVLNGINPAD